MRPLSLTASALLLLLSVPLRAQVAPALPDAPTPAEPASAATSGDLDALFGKFTSGAPLLPTLKDVQADSLRGPAEGGRGASEPFVFSFAPPSGYARSDGRRATSEAVDVRFSRPLPHLELGLGAKQVQVYQNTARLETWQSGYAFARVEFSNEGSRKLLHMPKAVHTQTETGETLRVRSDEYTAGALRKP